MFRNEGIWNDLESRAEAGGMIANSALPEVVVRYDSPYTMLLGMLTETKHSKPDGSDDCRVAYGQAKTARPMVERSVHNPLRFPSWFGAWRMNLLWIKRWSCLALVMLVAACASTTITDSWKNPAYKGGVFHSLLVVGVTDSPTNRRIFEEEFSRTLRDAGVNAIASYTLIPQNGKLDERTLKDAVRSQGLEGVLMTRLVRREKETVYDTTRYASAYAPNPNPDRLYGYYSTAWPRYGTPEVREYESVVLETTLWNAADSELVWTGTTSTFAPSRVQSATAGFAKVMIDALKERNLI